jgi:hypothetical protein
MEPNDGGRRLIVHVDPQKKGPDVKPETLHWLRPAELAVEWLGGTAPVRVTVNGEVCYLRVVARCAFPQSHPDSFVQLFALGPDPERDEPIGMLESLEGLPESARKALTNSMHENYLVPRIRRIDAIDEVRHLYRWTVETDRGAHVFEMERIHENIRLLDERRAICRDTQDNRYEIPDVRKLDPDSRKLLARYL